MHKVYLPLILIAIFVAGFFFAQENLKKLSIPTIIRETVVGKSACDEECKKVIKEEVEKALEKMSFSPEPQETIAKTYVPLPQTQIIPLGGTYSSIDPDWTDVPGSEVTVNVEKDYGKNATVSFHASLKIADGNGQAFARLYDATHSMVIFGSEISTINNSSYQSVSSKDLYLWSGYNTYKVQIKSPNSKEIMYTGGGLKIVIK